MDTEFIKEAKTRLDRPGLEFCYAHTLPTGETAARFNNNSFGCSFDLIPGAEWPTRYHASVKNHGSPLAKATQS